MAGKKELEASARTPLTRERIMRVAIQLADEAGVASLTMRKLAEKLEVEAMSLYHHVSNKDEILDGMVDVVFSEILLPPLDIGWKEAIRRRTVSARDALRRHPWAIGRMESRANPGLATLKHHDAVLCCFRQAGFSVPLAAHAFSVVDSYLYGFAMQEQNLPFQNSGALEAMAAVMLRTLPMDQYPHFTELIVEHALQPGYSYAHEFEFGLELILEGLEQRRAKA